jgi:hypothetical protein
MVVKLRRILRRQLVRLQVAHDRAQLHCIRSDEHADRALADPLLPDAGQYADV